MSRKNVASRYPLSHGKARKRSVSPILIMSLITPLVTLGIFPSRTKRAGGLAGEQKTLATREAHGVGGRVPLQPPSISSVCRSSWWTASALQRPHCRCSNNPTPLSPQLTLTWIGFGTQSTSRTSFPQRQEICLLNISKGVAGRH